MGDTENQPLEKAQIKTLLFGKYDFTTVTVKDIGLKRYINLSPIIVPHTDARFANIPFGKSKLNVVERLINGLMRTGRYQGKKSKAYKVVKVAFGIIEKRTKTNPIQILVNAIENSAPREETTRLIYGGISVPHAVDTSSSRRLDIALRNICKGAISATRKNKKSIAECLATEIINASQNDSTSFAIIKKDESERIAVSAR